jgi:hypothetical protein
MLALSGHLCDRPLELPKISPSSFHLARRLLNFHPTGGSILRASSCSDVS